jgi:hypothetical protein
MADKIRVINAVRYLGGGLLLAGMIFFACGLIASGFGNLAHIGVGLVMGAVFIFLMGMFFAAAEEMVERNRL